jgi:hypothetical protein
VRGIVELVLQTRGSTDGFNVKISSTIDERLLPDYAAAGATWCNRWIPPGSLQQTYSAIAQGPPESLKAALPGGLS